jgi:hypothetical protein
VTGPPGAVIEPDVRAAAGSIGDHRRRPRAARRSMRPSSATVRRVKNAHLFNDAPISGTMDGFLSMLPVT